MSSLPSISAHWGDGAYTQHPSSFGGSNHHHNDGRDGNSGASGGGGFLAIQRNGSRSFSEGSSHVNNNSLSLGAGGRSISSSISAAFSTAHVRDVTTAATSSNADVRSRFGWLEPWRSPQDCREGGLALLYSMQEILGNVRRARETSMNALYTVVGRPSASAAAGSCANACLQPTSTRFANGASSDDGTSTSTTSLRLTIRGSSKRASRRVSIGPEAADAGGVAGTATATPAAAAAAAAATITSTGSASGEATLMDYVLAGQRGTRPASHLWLNDDEAAAVALATAAAASRSSASSSLPPSATSSPIAALTPGTLAAPATYDHRTHSGGRWGAEGEGAEPPRPQRGSGAGLAGLQPASAANRSGHGSGLASANLSTLASEPPAHAPAAAAAGAGDGVVAARTVNAAEESAVAAGGVGDAASPPGFAMTLPRLVSTPAHAAAPLTSTVGAAGAAAAAAASGKIPTVAPLRVNAPLATPPLVPAIPRFDELRMEQEVLRQQHQLLQPQHPHPRSEAAQRRQRALMHSDDDDGASADGDEDEDAYGNAAASSNSHDGPGWACDQTARPGVSRAPPQQQGAAAPAPCVPSAHLQPPHANSNVSISDGDGVGGYRHGQGAAPLPAAAAASAGAGVASETRLRHDDAAGFGDRFSGDSDDVVEDEDEDEDEDDRFSETNFGEGGHLACVPGDSLHQRYTLLKPLGVGRSSRVWLAVDSEQCSLARRQLIHQLGEREVRRLFRPAERPLFVAIKVFRCDAMYADCAMYEAKLSTFVKESVRRRLSRQQQHQSYQEHASRRPSKVAAGTDSLPASPTTTAAAAAYAVSVTAALTTARGSSPTHGAPHHHHNDSAHVEGGSSTPPPRPQGGTSSTEAPAPALRPRRRSSTQSGTGLSASSVDDAVRTFSDRLTTFRDAFTVEGAYGTHHCLVMDVLGAGVDAAINEAHLNGFPSAIARSILRASLQGLSVLAACHLIHTDLKPENLLFTDLEPTIAAEMRHFQAAQLHTSARGELWSSFTHRRESLQHYARRVQQERAAVASGTVELVEGAVGDSAEGRDLDQHPHRRSRQQCRGRRAAYEVRVSDFGLSFIVPPCLRCGVRALTAHVEATGDSGSGVEDELVRQDPVAQLRWLYTQQHQQRSSASTPVTPAILTTGSSAPGAAALPGHLGEAASPPPLLSPTSPPAALGLCVLDDVLEDAELQALEALEEARRADADEDDVLLDFGRDGLLLRVPGMPLNAIDAHERARASRHGGSAVEGSGVEEEGEGHDVDDNAERESAGFVSVRDVGIGAAAGGTRIAAAAFSSSGSAGGRRRWLREHRRGAPPTPPPPPHLRAALAEATDSGVLPPPTLRTASYHSPVANSLTTSANFRFGAAGSTPRRDDASSGHDSASPRDDVRGRLFPALHAGTPAPTSLTMPLLSAHVTRGLVETDDGSAVAVAPDAHLEKAHRHRRRRSSSSSEGGEAQGDVRHSAQEAEPRCAPGPLTRVPRIDGGAASPAALALRRLECHIIRNQRYNRGVVIQSREYRAPEVLLGGFFLPSCDVWSIGCIAYELVTGRFLLDCIADRERFATASAWQQAQRNQVHRSNAVDVKSDDDDDDDGEEHQRQQEPVPVWDGQPIYLDDTEQDLDVFHLKAMMRLLGPPPLSYLQQQPIGLYVDDFFDERGDFRFWEPGEAEEAGMTLAEPYRRRAAAEKQEGGQRPQLASQHSTPSSRSPVPAQHERISVQPTAATDNTRLTETEGDACASQQPSSLTDATGPREEPLSIHSRQVPTTELAGIGHSSDTGGAAAAAATPMTTAEGPSPSATPSSPSMVTSFVSSHSVPRVSATTGAAATTRRPPPQREIDPAASAAAARRGACDTCNYPVSTPDWQDVQAILRDKLGTAEEAADFERFLQRCLQWDPAQRATAAALLVDDWVVKYGSVLADAVMSDDDGSAGEGNA